MPVHFTAEVRYTTGDVVHDHDYIKDLTVSKNSFLLPLRYLYLFRENLMVTSDALMCTILK